MQESKDTRITKCCSVGYVVKDIGRRSRPGVRAHAVGSGTNDAISASHV